MSVIRLQMPPADAAAEHRRIFDLLAASNPCQLTLDELLRFAFPDCYGIGALKLSKNLARPVRDIFSQAGTAKVFVTTRKSVDDYGGVMLQILEYDIHLDDAVPAA